MSILLCEIFAINWRCYALDLYNRILRETEKRGLKGTDLGKLLDLQKSPLTDWKNKKSMPTTEQLIKLCDIFAISADYLLFGTERGLSENEKILITSFNKLSELDKQEILNFIDYKVYKSSEKVKKSFPSENDQTHKVV